MKKLEVFCVWMGLGWGIYLHAQNTPVDTKTDCRRIANDGAKAAIIQSGAALSSNKVAGFNCAAAGDEGGDEANPAPNFDCAAMLPNALTAIASFGSAVQSQNAERNCTVGETSNGINPKASEIAAAIPVDYLGTITPGEVSEDINTICPGGTCDVEKFNVVIKGILETIENGDLPLSPEARADALAQINAATTKLAETVKTAAVADPDQFGINGAAVFASANVAGGDDDIDGLSSTASALGVGRQIASIKLLGPTTFKWNDTAELINGLEVVDQDNKSLTLWDRATRRYLGDPERTRALIRAKLETLRRKIVRMPTGQSAADTIEADDD